MTRIGFRGRLYTLVPLLTILDSCGPPGPARPAEVDLAVVAVALTPAPAGQPSEAHVAVTNRGTRTLLPQDYLVEIVAPGSAEEMRLAAHGTQRTYVFVDVPVEIEPGHTEIIPVHHIFARAGTYAITVQASVAGEAGSALKSTTTTLTVTVPDPPCHC